MWLAKLSRVSDSYDILLAEHTALDIAREAGIDAPCSKLVEIGKERALLVKRFDIEQPDGVRRHLISANALLKDEKTQEDRFHATYDDLAELIRVHSIQPVKDLKQLLGQALLNNTLRNTDDHLRNFSFLIDNDGLRISPAYDIVPSPVVGGYHQLGWGRSNFLPGLDEAEEAARHLGLPAKTGGILAENIKQAIARHQDELEAAGALVA